MEIGNNVFMAYRKVADGVFEPLEKPNIDHGSGLERIAAAKIDSPDVFRISLMWLFKWFKYSISNLSICHKDIIANLHETTTVTV
jgi:alanyl-tRNA synthetase